MTNITAEQLVQREVIYCVSTLIHNLYANDKYQEDLYPIISQDDWETPAIENGWNAKTMPDISAQSYCDDADIEPQIDEALEHWIVTDWLDNKLETEGEMVLRDFMGMTIWGRTCSGQMIAMDSVIKKIHTNLVKAA